MHHGMGGGVGTWSDEGNVIFPGHPPGSREQGNTVNVRGVHILLECILVPVLPLLCVKFRLDLLSSVYVRT